MPTLVFGFVVVALLAGFARIIYELKTGKFFTRGRKVYTTRGQNPRLYWTSMILEIFGALLVTSVIAMTWIKEFRKH